MYFFHIRKNRSNKSLIYWNEKNECDDITRDRNDNIVSVFWPKLMTLKQNLLQIADIKVEKNPSTEKDVEMCTSMTNELLEDELTYIKAKLCSGEDDQTENQKNMLTQALKNSEYIFDQSKIIALNRICGGLTDMVLSLHRVQEMKNRMNQICTED